MKVSTATSERADRRARPHTPWPLVQPPPMRVPKPTSTPAIRIIDDERTGAPIAVGATTLATAPARSKPTRKATRQARSLGVGGSSAPITPLTPAVRPWVRNSRVAAAPIAAPPAIASHQV